MDNHIFQLKKDIKRKIKEIDDIRILKSINKYIDYILEKYKIIIEITPIKKADITISTNEENKIYVLF